ncbi:hypothetical protein RhiirA5_419170 [Rhizophagus irregularis]|uniref:PWWP domain-containing protein n=3 Tax=Rhizophagus irregularis TaxID=588596 RepID=U9UY56_RHIID|nr:hypothetical protein GLOIN_2v1470631 [Rhizophagus irregularis DAOM 181602=DAOM 197198]EXX65148.1 hypothetical protein RirG_136060 [Rhizophagus irregularis DAOM 197198w]PKC06715.1 hypothetical protein RhiirA5_419170 [Rhizophagus irregularis]PKC75939.1 hypothetical protein RhiirA1_448140 [Rhizophagus irregularis]POG81510.1 hypothetical protein GLOIN_2v1470631 [Rhizophagus irregularis DAOM 181602=DAOM 197198]CAB5187652.1 unnamed protein product [Rhizophagus irregularis]|eukprot:XP_025188376.1 hypothetical protein GLOIN_2v1470631 [Rhizophagus irregularis DAOM 181602=DAOM 197198]
MSELDEIITIFGVGDYVWVPWSTIINSISIKVKNESESSIITNKLIRYWPAFVLERHVTTKLRKVAYARIVPTSTPQNGNTLSPKYLVKLIGLNVNQVFYEKSLRSWLSFNPNPLPEIMMINDYNFSGQDISLSDITIEKLTVLYVQAVQKVSNKLRPAFDSRDNDFETSTAEPVKTNSSSPARLKIIYNRNSKDSANSQTSIYKPIASSINANTLLGSIDFGGHDRDQEKESDCETKKTFKLQTNIGSANSNSNIIQTPLNDSENTNSFIVEKVVKQGETQVSPYEQPIVLTKEQEFTENLNLSGSLKKKGSRKPSNSSITKLESPAKVLTIQDESSLLRRTRNGSVFGKWRASKRSRRAQNLEQDDSFIISKADAVQTKDSASKRKLKIGVKKTPIDQSRCPNQVNKDETELRANENKRRKIQDASAKEDDLIGNSIDDKPMEINSEPNNFIVECNNTVKSMLKPNATRMELYKRKNEGKSNPKTQNTTQILQTKAKSRKVKKEKKIRSHSNYNTKSALNVASLDLNQTLVEDNYMQQDDVSGMIEMKNEQERIVNNINNMNGGNNSLSLVFSSPIQSFRSVLGFGNIFSWNKSIDI